MSYPSLIWKRHYNVYLIEIFKLIFTTILELLIVIWRGISLRLNLCQKLFKYRKRLNFTTKGQNARFYYNKTYKLFRI